jgi:hypothetical protein
MQWRTVAWLALCAVGCSGLWSCGDDEATTTPRPRPDAGEEELVCQDSDGDGYGAYCVSGHDCDDDDPEITDECRRCRIPTTKGCRCEAGTPALKCDPPDKEADGGTLVCSEGTRYCRDERWGDCEVIGEYVFVPD